MTLRMTLTRPDLRTASDSNRDRDRERKPDTDPLALDELPPTRDARTIWDTVPRESGWRRMWRRVRGKNLR